MNKLALNSYQHNPVVDIGGIAVQNYVDELTGYNAGSEAKLIHTSVRVLQTGGVASIFQSGSQQQSDYLLTNVDSLCHFEDMSIRLTLVNNDAVNAALVLPSQYLLNYHEVLTEGGGVETVYNHNAFYDEFYLSPSDERIVNNQSLYASVGGIGNVAYASGLTIPASGTAVIYVKLSNMFTKTPVFIKALQKQIGIRCQWHPTGLLSTSLSRSIRVTDADLFISGVEYADHVQMKLMQRYRQIDHVFGYSEPIRAIIPGQTLNNTSKSNVKVTELSGQLVSQLVVFLVPAGAQDEAQFNFRPTLKLDLLRSGKVIGSTQDLNSDYWKLQMGKLFGTTAVKTNNMYVISFSKAPVIAANHGAQRGSIFMTTNDVLEIQSAVNGNFDVYVLAYRFNVITVMRNGNLVINSITN